MKSKQDIIQKIYTIENIYNRSITDSVTINYKYESLIEAGMVEMRNEILKIIDDLENLPDTYDEFEQLKEDIKNIQIK